MIRTVYEAMQIDTNPARATINALFLLSNPLDEDDRWFAEPTTPNAANWIESKACEITRCFDGDTAALFKRNLEDIAYQLRSVGVQLNDRMNNLAAEVNKLEENQEILRHVDKEVRKWDGILVLRDSGKVKINGSKINFLDIDYGLKSNQYKLTRKEYSLIADELTRQSLPAFLRICELERSGLVESPALPVPPMPAIEIIPDFE